MKARGRSVWQDRKTGNWKYQVRVPQPGSKPLVVQRTADSRQTAETRADQLFAELNGKRIKLQPETFSDLASNYLKLKAPYLAESTLANNKYLLDRYVLPRFSHVRAEKISSTEIQVFLMSLHESLAVASVNKIRTVMNGVFSLAVQYRVIESNPIAPVRPLRPRIGEATQVQAPWTVDEARKALRAVENTPIDFFIHATLALGLRKGEAMGLRWCDLDFERGIIEVRNSRGSRRILGVNGEVLTASVEGNLKTKASRRRLAMTPIVMNSLLRERARLEHLEKIPKPSDFVLLGHHGAPIGESTLYRSFNRIMKSHGVRRIRVHDTRHTAAVCALEAEVAIEKVTYGLGHGSTEVTKRIYAARVPALSQAFSVGLSDILSPKELATPGARGEEWVNV